MRKEVMMEVVTVVTFAILLGLVMIYMVWPWIKTILAILTGDPSWIEGIYFATP